MEAAVKRRIGRPLKAPTGKRAALATIVRSDIKRAIAKAARQSGRTQSQEVEHWLERLLQYESVLETNGGAVSQLLWRHGFTRLGISNPRTGQRGFCWAEPGLIENSGFVPDDAPASQREEPK